MALTPEHAARVLDLDLTARVEDVRRARRALAKCYHPDRCEDTERATRHMARVNSAADTLIAYLKARAARDPALKKPAFRDFGKTAETRTEAPKRESTERREDTRATGPKASPRAETPRPNHAVPVARVPKHEADSALIRFAAQAYSSVLAQIGGHAAGPTIDVTALRDMSCA